MNKPKKETQGKSPGEVPAPAGIPITNAQLINAITNESIKSRIRFRALLQLLVSKGLIEMSEYVAEYERQEQLSFVPLADMLFLDPDEFFDKHREWIENKLGGAFATLPSKSDSPRIALTPRELPDEPVNVRD